MDNTELLERAKLAEQAERYEDMVGFMTSYVESGVTLSSEERNLLSIAFKNVIGTKRASWRTLYSLEQKYAEAENPRELTVRDYRQEVEADLRGVCLKIISLIDIHILPKVTVAEPQIFFLKMKADYYRYLAEACEPAKRTDDVTKAQATYEAALELAKKELPPTNAIFLGLILNYSVFFYEILEDPGRACRLAKQTFEDAVAQIETQDDDTYKDSTLILQLLHDNLTLWNADALDGGDVEGSS